MKIMTFNIGNYDGDWVKRKSLIIESVKKEKPDILFMQEVFDDQRYQENDGPNQAEQISSSLDYKNVFYNVTEQIISAHVNHSELVLDGLLCLTNLPVLENRLVHLERQNDDKHYRSIQVIKVISANKEILFYNTHYSNRDDWAKLHLQETKRYLTKKKENPIILGDLNIMKSEIITGVLGDDFECSYDFKNYISFPSKNEVLDYVVIPKKLYKFNNVECNCDNCSDHRALIIDIQVQ